MASISTKVLAALVAVSLYSVAEAQDFPQNLTQQVQDLHGQVYTPDAGPAYYQPGGQYPQLNAPLYPSPLQHAPNYVGGAMITNQAFAPHEMLYPHDYHAMYPPFYHKVKGHWVWTPLGFRQHEDWKLQGTEVKVKYRANYPFFGGYRPPVVR